MPRFSSREVRARSTRKSLWLFGPIQTTTVTAAGGTITHSLNAAALALRPFTIVRTHGWFFTASDQVAASENYGAAYGISIVSDQASAIGITAVPTPFTDEGSSLFFVHGRRSGRIIIATAVGVRDVGSGDEFDSKAMRKVELGQDLVASVEHEAAMSGTITHLGFRILIKTN